LLQLPSDQRQQAMSHEEDLKVAGIDGFLVPPHGKEVNGQRTGCQSLASRSKPAPYSFTVDGFLVDERQRHPLESSNV